MPRPVHAAAGVQNRDALQTKLLLQTLRRFDATELSGNVERQIAHDVPRCSPNMRLADMFVGATAIAIRATC